MHLLATMTEVVLAQLRFTSLRRATLRMPLTDGSSLMMFGCRLTANYLANHIRNLRDIYQYFDGQAAVGHMFVRHAFAISL